MRRLGTIDLEILDLAMTVNGTFNESNLENSELKRLGVGKILDSLASLKDRKFISLNNDGSFSITNSAKEILWSEIPTWAKILRLLQIKSCTQKQIVDILRISEDEILENLEKLRKNQFVLMSPQRQEEKILKIYEILPEGIEEINETEEKGFEKTKFSGLTPELEITSLIDEILIITQNSKLEQSEKNRIDEKLSKLKNKLKV